MPVSVPSGAPGSGSGYVHTSQAPAPQHSQPPVTVSQLPQFVDVVTQAYPSLKDSVFQIVSRSDWSEEQKMSQITRLYKNESSTGAPPNAASMASMALGGGHPKPHAQPSTQQPWSSTSCAVPAVKDK